jgi:cation-transporting ATPase E
MNRSPFPPILVDVLAATVRATANTFTLLIVGLVVTLGFFGMGGDALFLASTISINTLIAIVQEVRAKNVLRSLELITKQHVKVMRNHVTQHFSPDQLQVGDHVVVQTGDPIPADGQIIEAHNLSVNQAMLTGESSEVGLHAHDLVYAGSYVTTGNAIFKVTAVNDHTRAGQMTKKLKWYEVKLTPLQQSLSRVIQVLTYVAIALAVLIYMEGRRANLEITNIINTIASGAISVVPEGLLLASTLLFSYGALKLMKQHVLIRRVAAVEGFSRLSVLCMDKTGTLTTDQLQVSQVVSLHKETTPTMLAWYLNAFVEGQTGINSTFKALAAWNKPQKTIIHEILPFSSSYKYSAVLFQDGSSGRALALGAPEILGKEILTEEQQEQIDTVMSKGQRVLLLVDYGTTRTVLSDSLKKKGTAIGFVSLKPTIRPDAEDTIFYLQAQGVGLKVISGDSLQTVQALSKSLGILHWKSAITGDELSELTPSEWNRIVPQTTLFCRVLPEQKERIIETLQRHGFVGMVGDGVNDALALKKADLSIAMAEGSEAARQVSDVILLDNRFASLPVGMRLGSQIILGVQMVSCLFFNKIILGATVLLLNLALSAPYPFTTRHLLLLNLFTVGIPTFIWSVFPAQAARRDPGTRLLRPTLRFAIPNGVISGLAAIVVYQLIFTFNGNSASASSATFFVSLLLGIFTFWLIPLHVGAIRNKTLQEWPWIYTIASLALIVAGTQSAVITELFNLTSLLWQEWILVSAVTVLAGCALWSMTYKRKQYVVPAAEAALTARQAIS